MLQCWTALGHAEKAASEFRRSSSLSGQMLTYHLTRFAFWEAVRNIKWPQPVNEEVELWPCNAYCRVVRTFIGFRCLFSWSWALVGTLVQS
jgi:hypothetical protein